MNIKVHKLSSLKNEIASEINNYRADALEKNNIDKCKYIAFSGDNAKYKFW